MSKRTRIGTKISIFVSAVLGISLLAGLGLFYVTEKSRLELSVHDKAARVLLALEAGHTQAMKHRGDKEDNNPVLKAFNGSLEYLSKTQKQMNIWMIMAPKVVDYQVKFGFQEIEPPTDDVDQLALEAGVPVGRFMPGNLYRYTVPVVMGQGPAEDPICMTCHGKDMGIKAGEVIGGFSVAYNASAEFGEFRTIFIEIVIYSILLVVFVAGTLIFFVNKLVSRPIADAAKTMHDVAFFDTEIQVPDPRQSDSLEITEILDAARVFNQLAKSKVQSLRLALDEHAIVSIADVDGTISFANQKSADISGYSIAELVGQNHRILKSNQHLPEFFSQLWQTISSGKTWHGEIKNRAKNGEYYWEASTIVPFLNERGQIFQYIAICTDITKTKKNEEELRASKKYAEEANRAKSNFLATMSHELRTPLTSIKGALGLMNSIAETDGKAENKELFEISMRNTDAMLLLINELLDYEKISSGALTFEADIQDVCSLTAETVNDNLGFATTHSVTFSFARPDYPAFAKINKHRFEQVLRNLLSNAAKFSNPGGKVKIFVENENGKVVVGVSDTGLGIPDAFKPKIFEAFTQFDPSATRKFSGTGLGLSISKALVENMGGELRFDSVEGVGSTFFVSLPHQPGAQ